jgi:hypothetical protein
MDKRNRQNSFYWETILAEQASSGLSASRFCRERGIKPTSYFSAKKRQQMAHSKSDPSELRARPMSPAQQDPAGLASSAALPATFVSVQLAEMPDHEHRTDTAIRVQLRSGHQLWVGSAFDSSHLGRLVAVLESAS